MAVVDHDPAFWLEERSTPPLQSNKARRGDADFGAPSQTKADNIGKRVAKDRKKAASKAKGSTPGDFESKHKRGAAGSHEGGKFVSMGGGAGDQGATEAAVKQALSPSAQMGIQASIRAFQKHHGLTVDGVVGRQTALALAGRYREARSTSVGAMSGREAALLRARHQPTGGRRERARKAPAVQRGGGGRVIASLEEVVLQEDVPFGHSWNELLHPRGKPGTGAGGQFVKRMAGGKGHEHSVVPEYDPSKLRFGKSAGGTTGARIAHHEDGSKWLVKTYGGNENRVATELLANAVYRQMGARVARAGRIRLHNGKQGLGYPLLDGAPRKHVFQGRDDRRSRVLGRHYMTDALLANWDFVGLEDDNVLWDPHGMPFRVDQGGTFEFRAQGKPKPFGPVPTEVTTMLLPGGQGARAIRTDLKDMRRQAAEIEKTLTPETVDKLVAAAGFRDARMRDRVRKNLKARAQWMGAFARGEVDLPQPPVKEAEADTDWWLAEGFASTFGWTENEHPRDLHGKFRSKIGSLGANEKLHIGGNVQVFKDKGGGTTYRVKVGNTDYRFGSADDAARHALDKSAADGTGGVGGPQQFKDYNAYLKSRGLLGVDTTHAPGASTFMMNGTSYDKSTGATLVQNLEARHAQAAGSDDKYTKRGAKTIKARLDEAKTKLKGIGGTAPAPTAASNQGAIRAPVVPPATSVQYAAENAPKAGPWKGKAQANPGHTLKMLHLEAGDKVQAKKGGHTYEVVKQNPNGMTLMKNVSGAGGAQKWWPSHSSPQFVTKADGSQLKTKEQAGTVSASVGAPVPAGGPPKPAGPQWSVPDLKGQLHAPPAGTTIGDLKEGDVIMTPDGKVGVMKPSEPAYTGYSSAYDISTGQKFEPPSSKPPVKYAPASSLAAIAAQQHLAQAQSGTTVSVASSSTTSAVKPKPAQAHVGPPPDFHGVASWQAATPHVPKASSHITSDQKAAIQSYTGSGYIPINAALRDSKSVKDLATAKEAAAIKKAFEAAPPVAQDIWIGRKTNNDEWKNHAQAGKVITDNGVISSAFDPNVWSGDIHLNVLIRKGSKAMNVSDISSLGQGEAEILLPPGSMFHVLKREEKGSKTVLYVEML